MAKIAYMQAMVQGLRSIDRARRVAILLCLTLAASIGLFLQPKIPLGDGYHVFADQRTIAGIPRACDVLSNALFLGFGVLGLTFVLEPGSSASFMEKEERLPYLLFFAGVALTGMGSAFYHLAPGDSRLPWDLLPMTVSFMSLLAATIVERISLRVGMFLLPVLVIFGFASVAFWQISELRGLGDYRFYLFAQYFPTIAIGAMVVLFPSRYTHTLDLFIGFVFYAVAKIAELLDHRIYGLGRIISGHTLKHLCGGMACYWILRMLKRRRAAPPPDLANNAEACTSYQGIS
jgi:hypothetical protein